MLVAIPGLFNAKVCFPLPEAGLGSKLSWTESEYRPRGNHKKAARGIKRRSGASLFVLRLSRRLAWFGLAAMAGDVIAGGLITPIGAQDRREFEGAEAWFVILPG